CRQGDQAVLLALGTADVDGHAGAVDVSHPQADDLAQTQAAGVGELQEHEEPGHVDDVEEAADLVGAEDGGQRLGPLAVGKQHHGVAALQGDAVEEAQGAGGLVEATPGRLLPEQVQLVRPGVLGAEVLGGAAEVPGEVGHGGDVALDGPGAVVAQLQVVDEALTQGRHGKTPEGGTSALQRRTWLGRMPSWDRKRKSKTGQPGGANHPLSQDAAGGLPTAQRFSSTCYSRAPRALFPWIERAARSI